MGRPTDRLVTPEIQQLVVSRSYFLVVRDRKRDRCVLWKVLRDEIGLGGTLEERYQALVASRRAAFAEFRRSHGSGHDDLELQEHPAHDLIQFRELTAELRVDTVDRWSP